MLVAEKKYKESQTQKIPKIPVGLTYSKKSVLAIEETGLLRGETHIMPKLLRFQGDVFESFVYEGSVSPVGVTT